MKKLPKKGQLTFDERVQIMSALNSNYSLQRISDLLNRSVSTIRREIKRHSMISTNVSVGQRKNRCEFYKTCTRTNICNKASCKDRLCYLCKDCNKRCPDFILRTCKHLEKPSFVCNGCDRVNKCPLDKRIYDAQHAENTRSLVLKESRQGANLTHDELKALKTILLPRLQKGQSIHAIMVSSPEHFTVNEKTLYRYRDLGLLDIGRHYFPRMCTLRPRKKPVEHKVDRKCRVKRTFEDFKKFIAAAPNTPVVEMDSVIGIKGGKCLLTIMFVDSGFMLAFLRDTNNAASVTAAFKQINTILNEIGEISFGELFTALLTDNGSEFSDPVEIEKMGHKTHPCNVFYCDPCNSNQKSQIERNHEFIRKILPKGTSFNNLTQEDINLTMSHINSYVRPSYGDMTPLARFSATFGQKLLDALGIKEIPAEEINLTPGLLKERI